MTNVASELLNRVKQEYLEMPGLLLTTRQASRLWNLDAGVCQALLSAGPRTLAQVERDTIVAMLERTGWRVEGAAGAAVLLGINPSTLRSRMLKLDVRRAS